MSEEAGPTVSFRPLNEREIDEIAGHQTGSDIADMFDSRPNWAPLTARQLAEKVAEQHKKPRTAVFAIYCGDELTGMGQWSASWDTCAPYTWFVVLPEHRRKGLGTDIGMALLEKSFMENPGHEISAGVSDDNLAAISMLKKLGFREIGRMRRTFMQAGEWHDILFFDILKSEYLAGVRP